MEVGNRASYFAILLSRRFVDHWNIARVNLLFDCHSFDAGPQGTTTFLAGLLNALPDAARVRGRSLAITCAARDSGHVDRFVTAPHSYEPIRSGFVARNLTDLPRLTRARGSDAVISQYVRPFRSHVPTVSVIHDVLFLDYPALFGWRYRTSRRLLFGWAARHSDVVVTVSEYSRERIAYHFGVDPARIDVLPNAVDASSSHLPSTGASSRLDAPLRLLYVSRFETRKRQHWCVSAARALAANGRQIALTLVGNDRGDYADEVRARIAAGDAGDASVTILSDIGQDTLDALYAEADLFLFPSECEGFGIPVIEAAAHGLPCVVSANTALRELAGRYAGVAVDEAGGERAFGAAVVDAASRLPDLLSAAVAIVPATRAAYRWPSVADRFIGILEERGILA